MFPSSCPPSISADLASDKEVQNASGTSQATKQRIIQLMNIFRRQRELGDQFYSSMNQNPVKSSFTMFQPESESNSQKELSSNSNLSDIKEEEIYIDIQKNEVATEPSQSSLMDNAKTNSNRIFSKTGKVMSNCYYKFWQLSKTQIIDKIDGSREQASKIYKKIQSKLNRLSKKDRPYNEGGFRSLFFPPKSTRDEKIFQFVNTNFVEHFESQNLKNMKDQQLYEQVIKWLKKAMNE